MERSTPSEQGVDPAAIAAFVDALEGMPGIEPHGLIVQRHGRRIAEGHWAPHAPGRIRLVYSLSKTFTGTALALARGDGRLTLDDLVEEHLPAELAGAGPRTRRMRIRHLASMATGHDRETMPEALAIDPADPVRAFLTIPPDAEPGTLFAYNQPPVLALATILQRRSGARLVDQLRRRVLDPIGVGDLRWAQLAGVDMGFSGVYTDLDAIARLGQLHLDDGVWDGRRLLPAGWVAAASSVQIANPQREEPDWRRGYGFQLWMSAHGYRGDGAFGQFMVVLPELDAVVAMFSCTEEMQSVLDLMWAFLVPAMGATTARAPTVDDAALADRLAGLRQPTAAERFGGGAPTIAPAVFTSADRPGAGRQRSITAVTTTVDRVVLHEGDVAVELPLASAWTIDREARATSATRCADGRVVVDVAFLATPHRLEVVLDPVTGTYTTRWPHQPLFGVGLDSRLSALRPPPAADGVPSGDGPGPA